MGLDLHQDPVARAHSTPTSSRDPPRALLPAEAPVAARGPTPTAGQGVPAPRPRPPRWVQTATVPASVPSLERALETKDDARLLGSEAASPRQGSSGQLSGGQPADLCRWELEPRCRGDRPCIWGLPWRVTGQGAALAPGPHSPGACLLSTPSSLLEQHPHQASVGPVAVGGPD